MRRSGSSCSSDAAECEDSDEDEQAEDRENKLQDPGIEIMADEDYNANVEDASYNNFGYDQGGGNGGVGEPSIQMESLPQDMSIFDQNGAADPWFSANGSVPQSQQQAPSPYVTFD